MKLNNKFTPVIKAFILISTLVSCNSDSQNKQENNKEIEKFDPSEHYPNKKIAFAKSGEKIIFYNSTNEHLVYAEINQKTNKYQINDIDLFPVKDLLQINDFNYFIPKKYSTFYKYPVGKSGTAGGDFFTTIEFNELGLIKSIEKDLPDSNRKYIYTYNKFAQLLKVFENKLLNKTLLENKYDENSNLIFQVKNYEELKSKREFIYGKDGRILKENIQEKNIAPNGRIISDLAYALNYEYDELGRISKKYTQDSNYVEQFQYDSSGRIVSFIKYSGELDKDDSNKLINHFIKKVYTYYSDQVVEERQFEYSIVNASILVDKKWQPINIEQQRKLGWKMLNEPSQLPLSETEKKYTYTANEVHISVNNFSFSNRVENGKTIQERDIRDFEKIKFILDNNGRIVKKETNRENRETEIEEYSY